MKKEAKKSFAKFVNSLFAFVLVVGLMPTSAAGDFTVGQAVNADPVNYTDANGNTPVANLAKQQAKKGLSLKWVDAETGADFDWNSTKVNRSTVVNGTWTQTQCSVTVSANDGGKTAATVVTVPWGKSYASVEGSAPQAPSRDGWQFLGWYTKDGQQYNFNSAVKERYRMDRRYLEYPPRPVRAQQLLGLPVRMHRHRLLRRSLGCTADQRASQLHCHAQQRQRRDRRGCLRCLHHPSRSYRWP